MSVELVVKRPELDEEDEELEEEDDLWDRVIAACSVFVYGFLRIKIGDRFVKEGRFTKKRPSQWPSLRIYSCPRGAQHDGLVASFWGQRASIVEGTELDSQPIDRSKSPRYACT